MKNLSQLDVRTKFKTKDIVKYLYKHHDAHVEEYEEAVKVHRQKVIEATEELKEAVNDLLFDLSHEREINTSNVQDAHRSIHQIVKPIDARKMYTQLITLFEATTEETIELSLEDANSIVNDEWDWAVTAKITNSTYFSSVK